MKGETSPFFAALLIKDAKCIVHEWKTKDWRINKKQSIDWEIPRAKSNFQYG